MEVAVVFSTDRWELVPAEDATPSGHGGVPSRDTREEKRWKETWPASRMFGRIVV